MVVTNAKSIKKITIDVHNNVGSDEKSEVSFTESTKISSKNIL